MLIGKVLEKDNMLISVVLCTYNPKEQYLSRVIQSLLGQTLDQSNFEFFIIDNNSNIPVSSLQTVKDNDITVYHEPKQGLTAARMLGTQKSKAPIIVFVDDDNILAPNYLSTVVEIFKEAKIGCVSGEVLPEYEEQPKVWFSHFEEMIAIRRFTKDNCSYYTTIPKYSRFFPIGAGISIRREIMVDYINSLNEATRIEGRKGAELSSGEDLDMDFFTISKGYYIGANSELKITHIIPPFRIEPDYIVRLATSSSKSVKEVNKKWKKYFNEDVFPMFEEPKNKILLRIIISFFLSWKPKYRIIYKINKQLLNLKN